MSDARSAQGSLFDVLIVGGGPAGLSAALALGRARKRVLVCDAGPRRNQAAVHLHNFVTRDGTPPREFRRVAHEELATYPSVELASSLVGAITGTRGAFVATLPGRSVTARRVLLATGMIDEMLPIPGFQALWGQSVFQCPYCHGFEVQDRAWGVLVMPQHMAMFLPFALQARGWTRDLTVYTNGTPAPEDALHTLRASGITVESGVITALRGREGKLEAVSFADGRSVRCEVLYAHPPQKQVPLVQALGLELDEEGFVRVDALRRETSAQGLYAAGDLTTRMQAAVLAAALGVQAAAMINVDLSMELAPRGEL